MIAPAHPIGATIRARREQLGLSQYDAALKAGTDMKHWSVWENGKRTPEPELLERIAGALQCPAESLANGNGKPTLTIGEAVRKRREQLGLSRFELGRRFGGYDTDITRIEEGTRRPFNSTIARLAAAMRCSVEELVTGTATNGEGGGLREIVPGSLAWEREESFKRQAVKLRRGEHFQRRHPVTLHPGLLSPMGF